MEGRVDSKIAPGPVLAEDTELGHRVLQARVTVQRGAKLHPPTYQTGFRKVRLVAVTCDPGRHHVSRKCWAVRIEEGLQVICSPAEVEDAAGFRNLDLGPRQPILSSKGIDHPLHVRRRKTASLLGAGLPVPLGLVERTDDIKFDALVLPQMPDDVRKVGCEFAFLSGGEIGAAGVGVAEGPAVGGHGDRRAVDEGDEARDSPGRGRLEKPPLAGLTIPVKTTELLIQKRIGPPPLPADVFLPAATGADIEAPHRQPDTPGIVVLIETGFEKEIRYGFPFLQRPPANKLDGPTIRCPEPEHLLPGVPGIDRDCQLCGQGRPQVAARPRRTGRVTRNINSGVERGGTATRGDHDRDEEPQGPYQIATPSPRAATGDLDHLADRAISMGASAADNGRSR